MVQVGSKNVTKLGRPETEEVRVTVSPSGSVIEGSVKERVVPSETVIEVVADVPKTGG